jgi:HSP20 family protein
MEIIQWRPFRDMAHWESLPTVETLQEEMNRIFHQLSPSNGDSELMAFMPSAELEDTPDAIHLKLEISLPPEFYSGVLATKIANFYPSER